MTARLAAVLALAGRQHGLVRQAQLDLSDIDRHATGRLVRRGVLTRVGAPGILRVTSSPQTWRQELLCAVWSAGHGAAASHRSAGELWEFDASDGQKLEITVNTNSGARPRGYSLYRYSDLDRAALTALDGIPTTEPTRTLLDLAAVLDDDALEAAVESALRTGRTSLPRARKILERYARPGRPGVARLRRVLELQEELDGVTESMFETKLVQVVRAGGLPEPVRQVELWDDDGFVGRFDVTYPDALVAIEADSLAWHRSPSRFEADRIKRARAEAMGWRVPAYTWRQVMRSPEFVVKTVGAILAHGPARGHGAAPITQSPRRKSA